MAISPRPRGGEWLDDEMKGWRRAGIDLVVSLLEPAEAEDLGLDEERKYCDANGMEFYTLPIVDRSVPDPDAEAEKIGGRTLTQLLMRNAARLGLTLETPSAVLPFAARVAAHVAAVRESLSQTTVK